MSAIIMRLPADATGFSCGGAELEVTKTKSGILVDVPAEFVADALAHGLTDARADAEAKAAAKAPAKTKAAPVVPTSEGAEGGEGGAE